ncbi:MAG: hypothetical protein MRERV_37c009 [Mycoplasmataceae bacterium RV_VA103A]|nr:MAG: hypothetical protein MRERV_37c009 [Mycoplasmataceae bacterium RV_VA103A]
MTRTRKTATKELLKEESQNLNFYPAPGVRYPRKSLRILQFATKVSLDFDSQVREIANKEGIYIAEVLERCLAAYLYCKDKGINVDDYWWHRERESKIGANLRKNKKNTT